MWPRNELSHIKFYAICCNKFNYKKNQIDKKCTQKVRAVATKLGHLPPSHTQFWGLPSLCFAFCSNNLQAMVPVIWFSWFSFFFFNCVSLTVHKNQLLGSCFSVFIAILQRILLRLLWASYLQLIREWKCTANQLKVVHRAQLARQRCCLAIK